MVIFGKKIEIGDDTILRRNSDMLFNEIDREVVMLSIENGEYYGLENVGSRIWELLETPIKYRHLVDILLNEYEVSEKQCADDTLSFVTKLLERNIIHEQ